MFLSVFKYNTKIKCPRALELSCVRVKGYCQTVVSAGRRLGVKTTQVEGICSNASQLSVCAMNLMHGHISLQYVAASKYK